MNRRHGRLLAGAILAGVLTIPAAAQVAGLPPELAAYWSWTKLNAAPPTDPSNPRGGP
jgi:hypothetical protein